mmetsp:Transcript_19379/g.74422  ORF Transcript_19379/g.74422 Transcript_19379/m.74422 type:complete len:458 (-) Transcript_19379:727-2100(-)
MGWCSLKLFFLVGGVLALSAWHIDAFPMHGASANFGQQGLARMQAPHSSFASAVENTTFPTSVNVVDYGALGDGATDCTDAFKQALADVGNAGGGVVLVPRGQFLLTGGITVPEATSLVGTYVYGPSHGGLVFSGEPLPDTGSVLLATGDEGNADGTPLVTLLSNSVLQGLLIMYPNQSTDTAPVPYPWTVMITGSNSAVLDCELLNPYMAINGTLAARHLIRNVFGQPLYLGLWLDQIYDIGRVENVHWNPWYSQSGELYNFQLTYGVAFTVGRSDWQYFFNTFAYGYAVGYHFIETTSGSCNGNFLGIGADLSINASVKVEQGQPMGILITNGQFTAFQGNDSTQVVIDDTNTAQVTFTNCAFWGPCEQIATVAGNGFVTFNSCSFLQWDSANAAIQATGGSLSVTSSTFQQASQQISLSSAVSRAVIVGNLLAGQQDFDIPQDVNAEVGLNASG